MFRSAVEGLASGLRTLDFAAAAVAIPIATAAHAWLPDRSVERLGFVIVPAVTAVAVLLWASLAWTRQTPGGVHARYGLADAGRPVWISAGVAALLFTVALATRPHEGSRVVMVLAIALAVVAAARVGWWALPVHPSSAVREGARARAAAPARAEPSGAPAARAPAAPAPASEELLRGVRARMDEVAYRPGAPNVLSMTKRLTAADGGVPGPETAGAGTGLRLSWARADEGDLTRVRIAGVLDASEAPALRLAFDGVVAERRTSVVLDLSALESIDSTGVGVVVGLLKRCRTFGGAVRVTGARRQPLAVLRLLRLEQVLGIE